MFSFFFNAASKSANPLLEGNLYRPTPNVFPSSSATKKKIGRRCSSSHYHSFFFLLTWALLLYVLTMWSPQLSHLGGWNYFCFLTIILLMATHQDLPFNLTTNDWNKQKNIWLTSFQPIILTAAAAAPLLKQLPASPHHQQQHHHHQPH